VIAGAGLSDLYDPLLHLAVDGGLFGAFIKMAIPLSLPAVLKVVIFTFTLTLQEFVYALTFISSSAQKSVTLGVATDLIPGDIFFWGEIMAGALLASVPVAIAYNFFLDRFISGITGYQDPNIKRNLAEPPKSRVCAIPKNRAASAFGSDLFG
jgi:ABC-type spermidine/putrescine transport system permease subunit I